MGCNICVAVHERSDCLNYKGITLLLIVGKILAHSYKPLQRKSVSIHAICSTIDIVFILPQVQEKCRDQNMAMYSAFIDLTMAFDQASEKRL